MTPFKWQCYPMKQLKTKTMSIQDTGQGLLYHCIYNKKQH